MASGTGHFCVFSFQFKSGFIVVEFNGGPVVKSVAALAIGDAVLVELPAMDIFVTGRAGGRQAGKFLVPLREPAPFVLSMASHAGLFGMRALQAELRLVVIEAGFGPAGADMAAVARLVGVVFGVDKPLVHIFMAIGAVFADIPEPPFFIRVLFVARETRRGGMPAVQRKFGFAMVGNRKQTAGKAIHGVAPATIGTQPQDGSQLAFVVIRMAGIAAVVPQRLGVAACSMAFAAIDRFMPAFQFKAGEGMVEVFHGARRAEGVFRMAVGAGVAEFTVMSIPVATGAIIGAHPRPVLKDRGRGGIHRMASGTFQLPVPAF